MKRRIVAIICIMFLLFTITSPLSGSIFSYADEPQQEQLSQDEVIKAAIALYLNERKAWITSTASAPIDAVQNVMQSWIDSYDFWTNHTTIGSAAEFYAQCVVKYNPFRISLKGPAVRALNDLYNWLLETGKLGNLDESDGGQTTDNLYQGEYIGNDLFYIINSNNNIAAVGTDTFKFNSLISLGTPVNGWTSDYILQYFNNNNSLDMNNSNQSARSLGYFTCQYSSNISKRYNVWLFTDNNGNASVNNFVGQPNINPNICLGSGYVPFYSSKTDQVRGNTAWIVDRAKPNQFFVGFVSYNATRGFYIVHTVTSYSRNDSAQPINSANVNLDTDNFNKTDPTPPTGDDEVTYTPEDKTTGDTYNTYNEYISNYVTKNTVVNNNNSGGGGSDPDDPNNPDDPDDPNEPETPGGTTPPWDNSSGAGTLTPDGNGGYTFNLPDLTLPDLNIDWNLRGLSEKFPFSIPWDLMAFFTVLNAEPETPAIEAQIDLGIVDWDIDWDLHNFDNLAALLRNLEFIGFCLALILITRSIIKG